MTIQRFAHYSRRESEVFRRFLAKFEQKPKFQGIEESLENFESHPKGTEDYDIMCSTPQGYITFDIQESENFRKYGDLRIDYVSAFSPPTYRTSDTQKFKDDLRVGEVVVDKWGKVMDPKAQFLVCEFHNGQTQWQIYNLHILNQYVEQLEGVGEFKTNQKRGESWGSAFLAVKENHAVLKSAKPTCLQDILICAVS